MTNVRRLEDLASRQHGLIGRWQLVEAEWSATRIEHALAPLRRVHDGVYVTGLAPLTEVQRWWAAVLTAPRTVLSHDSAGAAWGMRSRNSMLQTVTRPGRGGPQRHGLIRVHYSAKLTGHVARRHGMAITSPERTVIDLWHGLRGRPRDRERMLREAARTKLLTMASVTAALNAPGHQGRRGVASLRRTAATYLRLPLSRCKSDAEVEGLVVLDTAGITIPAVNERFAGEEADFCWPDRMLIIEIDGGSFHQDPLEDARKTRAWTLAGYTVHRIPSDAVYHAPERLLAIAR